MDNLNKEPRRDIQVTIYNTGGTANQNFNENSHNITHTSTTDSYNNFSRAYYNSRDLSFLQDHDLVANGNQLGASVLNTDGTEWTNAAYDAQELFRRRSMASAAPAQHPRRQTVPINVPAPSGPSARDNTPSAKSKNPFNNPFNPFWRHPSQARNLDTMGPSPPLAFQPQPQVHEQSRILDGVAQEGLDTEERIDGSTHRCPTRGSLSTRNPFSASPHPPRSSLDQPYGLLSQHLPELYVRSYFSSSSHGAPPRTTCGLCGTFHAPTYYQAGVQTTNPFTLPWSYWCPLVENSFPSTSLLETFPPSVAREKTLIELPSWKRV